VSRPPLPRSVVVGRRAVIGLLALSALAGAAAVVALVYVGVLLLEVLR
jgi:hypothetical protein